MTDQHRLLPRFRQPDLTHEIRNAKRVHEADTADFKATNKIIPMPVGGDAQRLRGLPALGYGIPGGHIRDTRPDLIDLDNVRSPRLSSAA